MKIKNWKTTLAGIAGILSVVSKALSNDWHFTIEDFGIITASIGLIFSKDRNVTGGTTAQYTPLIVESDKRDKNI